MGLSTTTSARLLFAFILFSFASISLTDTLELRKIVFLDKVDFTTNSPINNQHNSKQLYNHQSNNQQSTINQPTANTTFSNYLFRGNQPTIVDGGKSVFAYDLLKSYLAIAANASKVQLPQDYFLIDIKYIYSAEDPVERGDIVLEQKFFAANPQLGQSRIEPIYGDFTNPNNELPKIRDPKAVNLSSWQLDNLPVRIPALKQLLSTKAQKPVVIYFHCECGCDRTGEVGAAYAIKYLNMSYPAAMDWDYKIAGRPILINHKWAVSWYCYYLQLAQNISTLQCDNE